MDSGRSRAEGAPPRYDASDPVEQVRLLCKEEVRPHREELAHLEEKVRSLKEALAAAERDVDATAMGVAAIYQGWGAVLHAEPEARKQEIGTRILARAAWVIHKANEVYADRGADDESRAVMLRDLDIAPLVAVFLDTELRARFNKQLLPRAEDLFYRRFAGRSPDAIAAKVHDAAVSAFKRGYLSSTGPDVLEQADRIADFVWHEIIDSPATGRR